MELGAARGGSLPARLDRPGLWVRGSLRELDLDRWLGELRREPDRPTAAGAPALALSGFEVDVGTMAAFGGYWHDLRIGGRTAAKDLRLVLAGREVEGTAVWSPAAAEHPNGRLVARLSRLAIGGDGVLRRGLAKAHAATRHWRPAGPSSTSPPTPSFRRAGRSAGSSSSPSRAAANGRSNGCASPTTTVRSRPRARGAGPGGRSRPSWTSPSTSATPRASCGDSAFRMRYRERRRRSTASSRGPAHRTASTIRRWPARFASTWAPAASPRWTRASASSSACCRCRRCRGGSRSTSATSSARASPSTRSTAPCASTAESSPPTTSSSSGPRPRSRSRASADLERETQRLQVKVQPALSAGVSAGAALLFLANPVVGAAVGAGSLLAQKILQDPIEQMFSYTYNVAGSWSDPVVTRGGSATAPGSSGREVHDDGWALSRRRRADGLGRRRRRQPCAGGDAARRGGGRGRASGPAARVLRHHRRARDRQGCGARARRRRPAAGVPRGGRAPARDLGGRRVGAARLRRSCPRAQRVPRLRPRRRSASPATTRSTCSRLRKATRATTRRGRSSRAACRWRSSCPAVASGCRSATTCAFPSSTGRWARRR